MRIPTSILLQALAASWAEGAVIPRRASSSGESPVQPPWGLGSLFGRRARFEVSSSDSSRDVDTSSTPSTSPATSALHITEITDAVSVTVNAFNSTLSGYHSHIIASIGANATTFKTILIQKQRPSMITKIHPPHLRPSPAMARITTTAMGPITQDTTYTTLMTVVRTISRTSRFQNPTWYSVPHASAEATRGDTHGIITRYPVIHTMTTAPPTTPGDSADDPTITPSASLPMWMGQSPKSGRSSRRHGVHLEPQTIYPKVYPQSPKEVPPIFAHHTSSNQPASKSSTSANDSEPRPQPTIFLLPMPPTPLVSTQPQTTAQHAAPSNGMEIGFVVPTNIPAPPPLNSISDTLSVTKTANMLGGIPTTFRTIVTSANHPTTAVGISETTQSPDTSRVAAPTHGTPSIGIFPLNIYILPNTNDGQGNEDPRTAPAMSAVEAPGTPSK
ncbi:hypothetical protein Dda_1645 [Drechslerella dactyloides]|uniref:Uncharacterized protein n=1 Tax=Drechslerella dactyloides TaxID=74499 RepID=A0AAD6J6G4_DREDA|nr:hypothetical protein Dda_1645 [Drechslerella dactyloides]